RAAARVGVAVGVGLGVVVGVGVDKADHRVMVLMVAVVRVAVGQLPFLLVSTCLATVPLKDSAAHQTLAPPQQQQQLGSQQQGLQQYGQQLLLSQLQQQLPHFQQQLPLLPPPPVSQQQPFPTWTTGSAASVAHLSGASQAPSAGGNVTAFPSSGFVGLLGQPDSVASPMYPSCVNETLFQYSSSPSSTLDFIVDSGATDIVLRDAGTLRPLPTPTSLLSADSSFSIPCHNTSTLPCPLFPSGIITGRPVRRLHSDGGGEFLNNQVSSYFQSRGIIQNYTLPHSPQQNGVAESRVREITKIAWCLLVHASCPPSLWGYALLHAALLTNLYPHPLLPSTTPTELWTKGKPDVSSLRVWGSKAYVLSPQ
ncbi:unnamed protein product, partial [Closterium sp. NIES-54]